MIRSFVDRWWRFFVLFCWMFGLAGVLKNERYLSFLRPEFGVVLGIGAYILLGFLAALLAERNPSPFDMKRAATSLILLLPIAYLANAQGASLDASALRRRPMPASLFSPELAAGMSPLPATSGASPYTQRPTLLDLYAHPRMYSGKKVSVIGIVHRNEEICRESGRNVALLFRFLITCCAADATPLGVLVSADVPAGIGENAWAEVEGRFMVYRDDGMYVPVLEDVSVRSAEAPERPYLY